MAKAPPSSLERFLEPLARWARKHPGIEGLVFWGSDDGWGSTPSEALEAEEIAFYAEGLLIDGFHMVWTLVALAESPDLPDHLRLQFWQDGAAPPPLPTGWVSLAAGSWDGASLP